MPGIRSAARPRGAGRPVLARALLRGAVVAGIVVGGWMLGSATASAEPLAVDSPGFVIDEVVPDDGAAPVSSDGLLDAAGTIADRTVEAAPVPLPSPSEIVEPVVLASPIEIVEPAAPAPDPAGEQPAPDPQPVADPVPAAPVPPVEVAPPA
ncbi:MAG: hypothetical protein ACRDRZ_16140, partial [Pseudonocardiaceae bacterium]